MNRESKARFIGDTSPRSGGANNQVDPRVILERSFEHADAEAYLFCSGCSSYFELKKNELQELEKRTGEQRSFDNEYFETESCPQCGGYRHSVKLKEVLLH